MRVGPVVLAAAEAPLRLLDPDGVHEGHELVDVGGGVAEHAFARLAEVQRPAQPPVCRVGAGGVAEAAQALHGPRKSIHALRKVGLGWRSDDAVDVVALAEQPALADCELSQVVQAHARAQQPAHPRPHLLLEPSPAASSVTHSCHS